MGMPDFRTNDAGNEIFSSHQSGNSVLHIIVLIKVQLINSSTVVRYSMISRTYNSKYFQDCVCEKENSSNKQVHVIQSVPQSMKMLLDLMCGQSI